MTMKQAIINNPAITSELGERLYIRIKELPNSQSSEMFYQLTQQDCINFISDLITYNGFIPHKSVIEDNLAKEFPNIRFEQSDPELDHAGDIDYLGWVGDKAFGIQIKPITAKANFGNYSPSERMKASFNDFTQEFGGKVFIVYSIDDKIKNQEVVAQIADEIKRLTELQRDAI